MVRVSVEISARLLALGSHTACGCPGALAILQALPAADPPHRVRVFWREFLVNGRVYETPLWLRDFVYEWDRTLPGERCQAEPCGGCIEVEESLFPEGAREAAA